MQAAIEAVAEVGNPTVVATLTVVAALLPMLFVSGLMGPYMAPIPANASAAMLFSFFVAMVIAPWLMLKLAPAHAAAGARSGMTRAGSAGSTAASPRRWCAAQARPGPSCSRVGVATLARLLAVRYRERDGQAAAVRQQVGAEVVRRTCPRAPAWRRPNARCSPPPHASRGLPEVLSVQAYAGTAAPFNFNGLVRHYYLRQSPELGDLHVNLAPKAIALARSHAIALDLRQRLAALKLPEGTVAEGGRGAARPAGAGDAAGRGLRPGRRHPPGRRPRR